MTEPSPEAGSHPGPAWKPSAQQSLFDGQKLLPSVTSFVNDAEVAYKAGLTQPSDPFPMAIRAALIFEKNPATKGAEAEVPPSFENWSPTDMTIRRPVNEISGKPLPLP